MVQVISLFESFGVIFCCPEGSIEERLWEEIIKT